ncbi:ATP-dependent DNA helicase [Zobellella denitrificans]|uniref:AlbA family DNA-binding domain-containing protein n=1 Tax=Zobellella denitrificans TaxID=347534 RepID=UPI000B8BEC34|nr:helix-turn-helix domain-containing protein [Zobellella denitrificans]OXS13665.1 ATP-dependent DNA helicase [Zobellella denitrificans]
MSAEHPLWHDIQQGEGKTLEFKRQLPKGEQLAKTMVAFANTAGGKLVLGVDDQRQIVGLQADEFELMDQIASLVHDLCQPTLLPNIYLETLQGQTLLVVQVHRGSQLPYYLKRQGREKGVFVRLGATNRQASQEMIHELECQRLHQSFDEQPAWDSNLEQLDLGPLQQAFRQVGKPLDRQKMHGLKLIKTEQGREYPTHGLMILLGRYEQVEIKCSRFKGTDMTVFLDKKEYTGDLFGQLAQAEGFIKNHLHLKAEILGLQRTETYEIPIAAIREALVNAVVHRDYSNAGRDIKLGIYDDAVNIVSPGGLPNGLTLDEALQGRSELRNKVIARVFKELGYIEQWGSGIARIRALCTQAGNPEPTFAETGDFFDIEFHRAGLDAIGGSIGGSEVAQAVLTERQQAVLELIKQNPRMPYRQMASELGINDSAVKKHLEKLKEANVIERIGGTRGYWKVKD